MNSKYSLGIVGARGHTGAELIALIARHPYIELTFVSSRELAGQRVSVHHAVNTGQLQYESLNPEAVAAKAADVVVLALPNGKVALYVTAINAVKPDTIIIDLSADYRFDPDWYYGLPELTRTHYSGQKRISNPGCYATAMQLAIAPMREMLAGPAQCFGVSGYSGAGTTPSDKNNPELLRDNLMPYALCGHIHEREVSRHIKHPVHFMPHVAPWFRGITMTVNLHLQAPITRDEILTRYQHHYQTEPLIEVIESAPWVSHIAGKHGVQIGGFTLSEDGRRLVVVATLDNLLKGAATQALQNINLALGLDEMTAIPVTNGVSR